MGRLIIITAILFCFFVLFTIFVKDRSADSPKISFSTLKQNYKMEPSCFKFHLASISVQEKEEIKIFELETLGDFIKYFFWPGKLLR